MYRNLCKILVIIFIGFCSNSCVDDFLTPDFVIGEGMAKLSATVNFQPLILTNTKVEATRGQSGSLLSNIDNLTVFLYNIEGKLVDIYDKDKLEGLKIYKKDEVGSNKGMPNDAVGGGNITGKPTQAEQSTARATFSIVVPYGTYYLYAVANMGDLTESPEKMAQSREDFATVKDLQTTSIAWNPEEIGKNSQMFGYFTMEGNGNEKSSGFDGDLIIVNKQDIKIHSWLKREASKVTVVYDGSNLKNDIWIYIKSVTIKDIPRQCKLGADNTVSIPNITKPTFEQLSMVLIPTGDHIDYDSNGEITEGQVSEDYKEWMVITKGSPKKGAVKTENEEAVEHSEYNQALYFYENMQGNYSESPNKKYYSKEPDWDYIGYVPTNPEEYDFKDNVPYGTYIEVEAYYVSQNPDDVSEGNIKYRYMLGQNDTYDYNAIRNHHYKLTLGFNGYANQPDWHIEYIEPDNTIFLDPTYYISYGYNHRAEFPVRIRGDIQQLEIEIVENNWAPYDPKSEGNVPAAVIYPPTGDFEQPFRWNKTVYDNTGGSFYYGLQKPWNSNGTAQVTYSLEQIDLGAPEKVTPIWAGFLALQVEDNLTSTLLPGGWTGDALNTFKRYYYDHHQNIRTYDKADLTFDQSFDPSKDNQKAEKTVGSGNNITNISRAADGSITVAIPMWTRQKTMLGVSGFTGNNPYETYQRKAMVKVVATFNKKGENGETVEERVVKYMPIFQVRRVVNPKGIWRSADSNDGPFRVKLCHREGAASSTFDVIDSEGAWHAYVKKTNGSDFLTLKGGTETTSDGIIGATGSPIEFDIIFNNASSSASQCAIVEVEYHGLTCSHSIFVRQGYSEPLQVVDNGAHWSTFSLYRCTRPQPYLTQWDENNPEYIEAELTANPLTLGTLFKRGNYNGILISNNHAANLGALDAPGWNTKFEMSDQNISLSWGEIQGLAVTTNYDVWNPIWFDANAINNTFQWGRFKARTIAGIEQDRYYKLPSDKDFQDLVNNCDFGVGVVYTDGTTTTALTTDGAFGFEDSVNDGTDDVLQADGQARGIRGVIVYNPNTANQLFFSVGARGMGRRTITGFTSVSYNDFGTLRYSGSTSVLDQGNNTVNQYRPIPYNMPAVPGAIYWIDKRTNERLGWEMNYFDLNFNEYTYNIGRSFTKPSGDSYSTYDVYNYAGDALPIKLVVDETANAPKPTKRKSR